MKKIKYRFKLLLTILFIVLFFGAWINDNSGINSNSSMEITKKKCEPKKGTTNALEVLSDKYREVSQNIKLYGHNNKDKDISDIELIPGGTPVGIKLKTNGALVVGISEIEGEGGKTYSPAKEAGIQTGDVILKIDNKVIEGVEDIAIITKSVTKNKVSVIISRGGKEIEKSILIKESSEDGNVKLGLWVRDSTAGVGTLTFYDPSSHKFGALGHPITDSETGSILNVKSGEIISSNILSVKRGMRGNPGELRGMFVNENKNLGEIKKNTICGIFGVTSEESLIANKKTMKIAKKEEVKIGKAAILTTIKGKEPKLYEIEIEKLLSQNKPGPKSMVIKVVDKELLEETGGIVQGMSGSPIIQNNKIVGAVTHVLVNKPNIGYGIYIEWMLNDAEILNKN